jgi:hydroxyacylglutathione hydrolase
MDLVFEQLRTGGDRNFGYLIGHRPSGEAFAVDPSFDPGLFAERAAAQRLSIRLVLNTHGHADHTNGNRALSGATGAPVAAHAAAPERPDRVLRDGDRLPHGPWSVRVLHLPGHAPDHLVFFVEPHAIAITGDLLFVGKIGGTAAEEEARTERASLERLLRELPPHATVWPGHDYGARPSSTLALELASNPFLQARDLDAFLALKRDWAAFKARHGLR